MHYFCGALVLAVLGWAFPAAAETLALAPGKAVTLDRPHPGATTESLEVAVKGGQTLLVQLNADNRHEYDWDEKDELRVYEPGASAAAPSLPERGGNDAHYGQWLNRISQDGNVRIAVLRPSRRPYGLRLLLLDPGDPLLDPGLGPADVAFDGGPLAIKQPLAFEPLEPQRAGDMDEALPGHLGIVSDAFILEIMSVEGLARSHWLSNDDMTKRLARLKAALATGSALPDPNRLPFPGSIDAHLEFRVAEQHLEGTSFRFVRWVGFFAQDIAEPENSFTYVANGLSRDGRYLIFFSAQVKHPALDPGPRKPKTYAAAERALAKVPPSSWQPSLDVLDGVARSVALQAK